MCKQQCCVGGDLKVMDQKLPSLGIIEISEISRIDSFLHPHIDVLCVFSLFTLIPFIRQQVEGCESR